MFYLEQIITEEIKCYIVTLLCFPLGGTEWDESQHSDVDERYMSCKATGFKA